MSITGSPPHPCGLGVVGSWAGGMGQDCSGVWHQQGPECEIVQDSKAFSRLLASRTFSDTHGGSQPLKGTSLEKGVGRRNDANWCALSKTHCQSAGGGWGLFHNTVQYNWGAFGVTWRAGCRHGVGNGKPHLSATLSDVGGGGNFSKMQMISPEAVVRCMSRKPLSKCV